MAVSQQSDTFTDQPTGRGSTFSSKV